MFLIGSHKPEKQRNLIRATGAVMRAISMTVLAIKILYIAVLHFPIAARDLPPAERFVEWIVLRL